MVEIFKFQKEKKNKKKKVGKILAKKLFNPRQVKGE